MNEMKAIETVQRIFIGADRRDWAMCLDAFADRVELDYSSLSGAAPALLEKNAIVDAWMAFLPKFQATHHQLGNFVVSIDGKEAKVFFYGTAWHFFPNASGRNTWIVIGTYDAVVQENGGKPQVSALRFDLRLIDGNPEIPNLLP